MEIRDNAKDNRSPCWDISQERVFMENLVGQRFNFLLVLFSIFVAGAVNARSEPFLQCIVLTIGGTIVFFLMLTIKRAQHKIDLILQILFQDPTHPAAVINKLAKGSSKRGLVGRVVPLLCFVVLTLWATISWAVLIWKNL